MHSTQIASSMNALKKKKKEIYFAEFFKTFLQ